MKAIASLLWAVLGFYISTNVDCEGWPIFIFFIWGGATGVISGYGWHKDIVSGKMSVYETYRNFFEKNGGFGAVIKKVKENSITDRVDSLITRQLSVVDLKAEVHMIEQHIRPYMEKDIASRIAEDLIKKKLITFEKREDEISRSNIVSGQKDTYYYIIGKISVLDKRNDDNTSL